MQELEALLREHYLENSHDNGRWTYKFDYSVAAAALYAALASLHLSSLYSTAHLQALRPPLSDICCVGSLDSSFGTWQWCLSLVGWSASGTLQVHTPNPNPKMDRV